MNSVTVCADIFPEGQSIPFCKNFTAVYIAMTVHALLLIPSARSPCKTLSSAVVVFPV